MGKQVFYGEESRQKLLDGVNQLADAVVVTLGPRGRNVIIDTDTTPHITKDGVTVAKAIEYSDATVNLGAKVIVCISCNPSTQARDTSLLIDAVYSLENYTLVDQFPHTGHIEAIAKFIKK